MAGVGAALNPGAPSLLAQPQVDGTSCSEKGAPHCVTLECSFPSLGLGSQQCIYSPTQGFSTSPAPESLSHTRGGLSLVEAESSLKASCGVCLGIPTRLLNFAALWSEGQR